MYRRESILVAARGVPGDRVGSKKTVSGLGVGEWVEDRGMKVGRLNTCVVIFSEVVRTWFGFRMQYVNQYPSLVLCTTSLSLLELEHTCIILHVHGSMSIECRMEVSMRIEEQGFKQVQ